MERIRKVGTTLRNHWKKTTFFSLASVYGTKWYLKKLEDTELMKSCCREALQYGSATQATHQQNYHVTVILNPAASGGKARKLFEKYSAPLLHLAGFKVSVQKTEGREEAKQLLEIMDNCDAVLVAGGDGTLMEAVTGLLRRNDIEHKSKIPLGIIPVGKQNNMAARLFPWNDEVRQMAESTMAVIKQYKKPVSVMEIENLSEEMRGKKIYGLSSVEMGAFKEAEARRDSYWIFGGLKNRLTYVFSYLTGYREVTWDWPLALSLVSSHKVTRQVEEKPSGIGALFSKPKLVTLEDSVDTWEDPILSSTEQIEVKISRKEDSGEKTLECNTYPSNLSFSDFVLEGWSRVTGWSEMNRNPEHHILPHQYTSKQLSIDVQATPENGRLISVDGEEVDITGPIRMEVLPDKITMFCREEDAVSGRAESGTGSAARSMWSTASLSSNLMSSSTTSFKQRF